MNFFARRNTKYDILILLSVNDISSTILKNSSYEYTVNSKTEKISSYFNMYIIQSKNSDQKIIGYFSILEFFKLYIESIYSHLENFPESTISLVFDYASSDLIFYQNHIIDTIRLLKNAIRERLEFSIYKKMIDIYRNQFNDYNVISNLNLDKEINFLPFRLIFIDDQDEKNSQFFSYIYSSLNESFFYVINNVELLLSFYSEKDFRLLLK